MKLCDTCTYRNNVEQLKPCIIYRDNCEYYEKERGDMTNEQSIKWLKDMLKNFDLPQEQYQTALDVAIKALENIKAMGEDMMTCREAITDEKVLIGFNMAVAICNKYLGNGEEE